MNSHTFLSLLLLTSLHSMVTGMETGVTPATETFFPIIQVINKSSKTVTFKITRQGYNTPTTRQLAQKERQTFGMQKPVTTFEYGINGKNGVFEQDDRFAKEYQGAKLLKQALVIEFRDGTDNTGSVVLLFKTVTPQSITATIPMQPQPAGEQSKPFVPGVVKDGLFLPKILITNKSSKTIEAQATKSDNKKTILIIKPTKGDSFKEETRIINVAYRIQDPNDQTQFTSDETIMAGYREVQQERAALLVPIVDNNDSIKVGRLAMRDATGEKLLTIAEPKTTTTPPESLTEMQLAAATQTTTPTSPRLFVKNTNLWWGRVDVEITEGDKTFAGSIFPQQTAMFYLADGPVVIGDRTYTIQDTQPDQIVYVSTNWWSSQVNFTPGETHDEILKLRFINKIGHDVDIDFADPQDHTTVANGKAITIWRPVTNTIRIHGKNIIGTPQEYLEIPEWQLKRTLANNVPINIELSPGVAIEGVPTVKLSTSVPEKSAAKPQVSGIRALLNRVTAFFTRRPATN